LEFVAGNAADKIEKEESDMIAKINDLLSCNKKQIPGRLTELFGLWKKIVKKKKDIPFEFTSQEIYDGDVLDKACEILKTQKEHLVKTITRFINDINKKQSDKNLKKAREIMEKGI
jgi:alanyl-tRNA synthetase